MSNKKGCEKMIEHFFTTLDNSGGDEGSRTPVQKACPINFSECSYCLRFKQSIVQEQTAFADFGIGFPLKSRTSFAGILLVDVSLKS